MNNYKFYFFLSFLLISTLSYSQVIEEGNNQIVKEEKKDSVNEIPSIKFGGLLRFHYRNDFYNPVRKATGGDFAFDVFGVTTTVKYKKIKIFADYRFYNPSYGGAMLKEGYIGYDFKNGDDIQLGLVQTPFGNLDYNSYSWFLGIGYGLGFEGKYDLGIKYHHKSGKKWDWQLAFMKNSMETFSNDPELKSKSWSALVLGDNKEVNKLSGQLIYKINTQQASHKIGTSAQIGQLYNYVENKMGDHHSVALHYSMDYKGLGLKAQAYNYAFNPQGGTDAQSIEIGSFNYSYKVASHGNVLALAGKYTLPIKSKLLEDITFYEEYSEIFKEHNFAPSKMAISGIMFHIGHLYTYLEYVAGYNHPFLGSNQNSMYNDVDNKWHARLQCNFGYYF